jgi:hypothetical protein
MAGPLRPVLLFVAVVLVSDFERTPAVRQQRSWLLQAQTPEQLFSFQSLLNPQGKLNCRKSPQR